MQPNSKENYTNMKTATNKMTDAELGRWIAAVRAAYRAGLLSKLKVARLERILGWTWE
jgi:hypothetical protein